MEGSIILMVDNSAAVMILPTTFFDFTQEANDFYFPPLVGTYLRVLRVTVFLISLLITPAWYLMVSSPGRLPSWLDFLSSPEPAALSLLSQLLVVEFLIDVLKLASLNTPDTLSNSFSMLGALILGDFAVQAGWLGPEVLVYMAFVSVAGFAQPSYELGYAFKLLRVALLLLPSTARRFADCWCGNPSIGTTPERPAPSRTRRTGFCPARFLPESRKFFKLWHFQPLLEKMGALMKRTAGTKAHPGAFDEERRDSYHGSS